VLCEGQAIDKIQSLLSDAIPAYHAAAARNDDAAQQDQLRTICAAMASLLGQRLQGDTTWSQWRWVDDVLPHAVEAHSPTMCEVRGLAVWVDGDTPQCDPFLGSVRLAAREARIHYTLRFGDAAMGLGRLSTKGRLRSEAGLYVPREWLFSFSTSDLDA
jgi:hypothetical protein